MDIRKMESEKLGFAMLEKGIWTVVYTVPVRTISGFDISVISISPSAHVQIAISDDPAPVPPQKHIFISIDNFKLWTPKSYPNFFASSGEKIMAYSDASGVTVRVKGVEIT